MVAGLLYLIGLVAVLATIAVAGYHAPTIISNVNAQLAAGGNLLETVFAAAGTLAWTLTPLIGGLALMGFGRVIMLLGAISRSLREPG